MEAIKSISRIGFENVCINPDSRYPSSISYEGCLPEAVQQAFEILPVASVAIADLTLDLSVPPNSPKGSLQLVVVGPEQSNYYYQLLNFQGKTLEQDALQPGATLFDLNECPPGIYLLQVRQSHLPIHTFTIIKQ